MLMGRGLESKVIRADHQSLSPSSKRIGGRRRRGGEEEREEARGDIQQHHSSELV
jgi:hypothetical protein